MSRIWAALPIIEDPLDPLFSPIPSGACWWQLTLESKLEHGHELVVRTDTGQRLGCWEFYDGTDEQLIYGVDVFGVNWSCEGRRTRIEVASVDVPTHSPRWLNITDPGDMHNYQLDPWRHRIPASAFGPMPYPYAVRVRR